MFAAAEITRREWLTIRQVTEQRIADATRLLNRRRGPLADLPADETALRQGWDAGTIDWRRALIGAVVEGRARPPQVLHGHAIVELVENGPAPGAFSRPKVVFMSAGFDEWRRSWLDQ